MDVTAGVLLLSRAEDLNFYALRDVLQHRRVPTYHIDLTQPRSPGDLGFSIGRDLSAERIFDSQGRFFGSDDIRGVWCRSYAFQGSSPTTVGTVENFVRNEEIYALDYLLFLLGKCNWVNPVSTPFLTRRGIANRLIQARIAMDVGFKVPTHLVSNCLSRLEDFLSRDGGFINKQVAQGGVAEGGPSLVMTKSVNSEALLAHDAASGCPILLQEQIDKHHEIRAAVVGCKVFAAAIDTNSNGITLVDCRESAQTDLTYYRIDLSKDEESRLVMLNRRLGVTYSSIDLIRDKSGSLVFLEANPAGQWGFIELYTGYPITEAIADELVREH